MAEKEEEKNKEETFTLKQIIQIANVKKHDKLFLEKHFVNEEPKTLIEWKKLTKLTF